MARDLKRIAELEAENERLQGELNIIERNNTDHIATALRAEKKRLKCCGNCNRYAAGHYHPCGHGYGRNLMCHENCQYDPSRWEARP